MSVIETFEDDTSTADLTAGLLAVEDDQHDHRPTRSVADVDDRELIGVGSNDDLTLRSIMEVGGWSTALTLFGLNLVDEFDRVALQILGPDIQRTFDLSDSALALINGIGGVFLFAGAIPLGMLADRTRRTRLIAWATGLWAVFAFLGGVTRAGWQLALTRTFNGLGKGNEPAQRSMLADAYPIAGRGRVFAMHALANPIGTMIGPLLAGGIAAAAGGPEGWRVALMAVAVPGAILAVVAARLKEPGRGTFEQEAVLGAEHVSNDDELQPQVSISAAFDRLKKIRTFYYIMTALGALGFAIAGSPAIFNLLLEEQYGLDALQRGVVASVIALGAAVGSLIGGRYTDRLFNRDPRIVLTLIGVSLALFGLAYPVALFLPSLPLVTAGLAIAYLFVSTTTVASTSIVSAIVPFRLRGLGFGIMNLYLVLIGGLAGGLVAGTLSDRYGERTSLVTIVPLSCIVAGGIVAYAARFVRGDIALVAEEMREEQSEARRRADAAGEPSVLQIRNLDFSYGQVQVLFGVDVDVRRGEVLALLGTNGAGKSTLLKAICGLSLPSRGVVRMDGRNITYLSAEDRVSEGLVQVPGGKAIFPTLSVRENLLAGAYSFIWDQDRVGARIDDVLQLFPKLAERLEQPAGTMSGGEQQMLAIAKALLLDPKVLLIDELSLGLAPVIVQELLIVVERLKASGITIVVVEQSLNVALAIADRAVFMEKGQVRFEGPADELLERDDLVRAVFLGEGEG